MLMKSQSTLSAPWSCFHPTAPRRWPRVIGAWIERHRQRRALAELDDRLLKDIGITRPEADREIAKPFWWQ